MAPSATPSVFVTSDASIISTHNVLHFLNQGFRVSVINNLHNSIVEALARVSDLARPKLEPNLAFTLGDLWSKEDLEKVFAKTRYDVVIRFAGLKAVGESVEKPQLYFDNNLIGALNLYEIMEKYGYKKMVFSSFATVYGQPENLPCVEDFELRAMNRYGRTKDIARDIQKADLEWRILFLRYFNPVGAHESGLIGENPKVIPNNLMPYIQQVIVDRLPEFNVCGFDYPTKGGRGNGRGGGSGGHGWGVDTGGRNASRSGGVGSGGEGAGSGWGSGSGDGGTAPSPAPVAAPGKDWTNDIAASGPSAPDSDGKGSSSSGWSGRW